MHDPNIYNSNNYVVIDFETTNKDKGSSEILENNIVLTTLRLGPEHLKSKDMGTGTLAYWGMSYDTLSILTLVINSADFVVAHNAKFEDGWLRRLGIIPNLYYCTMLGEYTIWGNQRIPVNFDATAERYGFKKKDSLIKRLMSGGVCPSQMPRRALEIYGKNDTTECEQIFLAQRSLYPNLLPCMYTKNIFTPVLNDIQKNGIYLDRDRVKAVYYKVSDKYSKLEQEMHELTGGINPNSPKQVAEFIYDKLKFNPIKRGNRGTSIDVIGKLKPTNKIQRRFIELKLEISKTNAELTKALNKFMQCVDSEDAGVLTFDFNQAITRTHRLSSTGKKYSVQGQNLPRKFKPLFKARQENYLIVEADAAQLEFRAATQMAQDPVAIESINNKEDIHQYTADVLTSEGQTTSRQDGKEHTFKPLYGGMSGTKAEVAYYTAFKEKYKIISDMQEGWTYEVLSTGSLTLPTGMVFYWPDTEIYNSGYIKNTTNIYNYPVQYFATAEVIPIFIVMLFYLLESSKVRGYLVNTIHDSVIAEIHKEDISIYEDLVTQARDMTLDYLLEVYNINYNVPLDIEVKANVNWSDNNKWREEWLNAA